jgi:CRP/FNR family nitrogen fixation transcriptional regulator
MLTHTLARGNDSMRPAILGRPVMSPASPLSSGAPHALSGPIELMGAPMGFARNAEVYGEGEPADYLYKVIAGTVRTYKVLSDGRRQIGTFYLTGDVFGLEMGEEHTFSAEAITDSKVLIIKRSAVVGLAARDHEVARQLWALTSRELRRAQDHIMLLVKTAQERVASFLLEMARRMPAGNAIELPMSRQDIADYLGLTIETVSRTLTHLENAAAIELPSSRRIVLRNRTALGRLNG